jgi:predicted nucleic acid-binding protein
VARRVSELILFDTDVLIDAGRGVEAALVTIEQAEPKGMLAVSTVTHMELIVGARNKAELRAIDRFIDHFVTLSVDEAVSAQAVDLLKQYRLSHGLLIPDALIAATAISESIPLVSKNQRDYHFIAGLDLLPYPDSFAS